MGRTVIPVCYDWHFRETPESVLPPFHLKGEKVRLPHTWNGDVNGSYHRGACLYTRELSLPENLRGMKLFLEFEGANSVCTVYVNDHLAGTHRGGYSAFRLDITDFYRWDCRNLIAVLVDNSETEDVSPLFGDFTIFGGLYRDVSVVAVPETHFDTLYYGTQGIQVLTRTDGNGDKTAALTARIVGDGARAVTFTLYDPQGKTAAEKTEEIRSAETEGAVRVLRTELSVPCARLWNGIQDPALYRLCAVLWGEDGELDQVELSSGFRHFSMTPDRGMFLNGSHIRLHGVGVHQDREGMGNAVGRSEREEDFRLIREMGANMIRLTHYQHASYVYDMCDRDGYVVWTEIPMLSMTKNPALLENAGQQLTELILQNCHHPSIFFWGIQNEIAMFGEDEYMYSATGELARLAKELDPTRLSACANLKNVVVESPMNRITDMVGYNLYYGWYYGEIPDYETFFEAFHKENPQVPLGISEYGVDCNLGYHTDEPRRKDYTEEYQCAFHETAYAIMERQEWLWGSVIWNMFDFGSAIRNEGGTSGKNAKGLVSYDRTVKKDAFYYYKACWSEEPFVHVCGRRYEKRWKETADIKVYSNLKSVSLYINGVFVGEKTGDRVFVFEKIPLIGGEIHVEARSGGFWDDMVLVKVEEPVQEYIYIDPNPGFNVKNWFLKDSEELSTEKTYSLWDTVGDLKASSEAWKILKTDLPQLWEDPTFEKRNQYVLFKLINRASSKYKEETVKAVNEKLMKISKGGR